MDYLNAEGGGRPISLDFTEDQKVVDEALKYIEEKGCCTQLIVFDNLLTSRRSVNENDNDAAK